MERDEFTTIVGEEMGGGKKVAHTGETDFAVVDMHMPLIRPRGFPGDTLDRVRKYGVNAQELVTTSSTRLLMTT